MQKILQLFYGAGYRKGLSAHEGEDHPHPGSCICLVGVKKPCLLGTALLPSTVAACEHGARSSTRWSRTRYDVASAPLIAVSNSENDVSPLVMYVTVLSLSMTTSVG